MDPSLVYDQTDADITRLRKENQKLEAKNHECRRNLELMKKNMDLQKAKILSEILSWLDHDGANKQLLTENLTSVYNEMDTRSSRNPESCEDFNGYSTSSALRSCAKPASAHATEYQCRSNNACERPIESDSFIRIPDITYRSCHNQRQNRSGNVATSIPSSGLEIWKRYHEREDRECNQHNIRDTSVKGPIPENGNISSENFCNQNSEEMTAEQHVNDDINKLCLNERQIIDRPIDTILGKPPMTLYQACIYANALKPKQRLIGEIAFQLERRILDYVFSKNSSDIKDSKKRRFYGYTLKNIENRIKDAAKRDSGKIDPLAEEAMRKNLSYIKHMLASLNYDIDFHSDFAERMVNFYGLLNVSPEQSTIENFGLEDPRILRVLLAKVINDETVLKNMLILLDCLCFLSHHDKRPLFLW